MMDFRSFVLLVAGLACLCVDAGAGEADVVEVVVSANDRGGYDFAVTVTHGDTGWKHYADRWDILDGDGKILGTRTLHHPHVNEQPFTRSLFGVKIPDHVREVTVRAGDSVHEYGGKVVSVELNGNP
jgi:hypothetical protein